MSRIKLFYFPGACSLAPHILLHETGLSFASQAEAHPFSDNFLSLNPKAKLPVLTIDDHVITENPAIMTAISTLAPEKNLTGAPGTLEAVNILQYMVWLCDTLHGSGFGVYLRPHRYSDNPAEHDNIKQKAAEAIEGCYKNIEQGLGTGEGVYVFGAQFTAVDAYLFVFWRWGLQMLGWDMGSLYPKYRALAEAVAKREATLAALKTEGLE